MASIRDAANLGPQRPEEVPACGPSPLARSSGRRHKACASAGWGGCRGDLYRLGRLTPARYAGVGWVFGSGENGIFPEPSCTGGSAASLLVPWLAGR